MAKIYSESQKDILRQTPIVAMMARAGYNFPTGKSGGIFKSPFRDDSNPSFHVTHQLKTDLFFDHGGDRLSGDSYDFAKLLLEKDGRDTSGSAVWDYLAQFHPGIIPEEKTARRVTPESVKAVSSSKKMTEEQPQLEEDNDRLSYVCHSGGAKGADTEWGLWAEKYGMVVKAYWYSEKTYALRPSSLVFRPEWGVELTEDQYEEGLEACVKANETLRRLDPRYMNPFTRHLVARDWMQVKNADAVYAIGTFLSPKIVNGGTGWAVQMAIDNRKPVYFYNQDELQWYEVRYDKDGAGFSFVKRPSAPVLTIRFAGIGSRELSEYGRKAIADTFLATSLSVKNIEKIAENTVNAGISGKYELEGEPLDVWYSDGKNAILSNLNPCNFYYEGRTWNCIEQAFQWKKAIRFGDKETAEKILSSTDGPEIKAIGREVRCFDEKTWAAEVPALLHDMVYASCLSDLAKAKALIETGRRPITHVKGGPVHSKLFPEVLMAVREEIRGLFGNEHSFEINDEDSSVTLTKDPEKGLRLDSLKKFYSGVKRIPLEICDKDLFTVAFTFNGKSTTRYAAGNPTVDGGYNLRCADWVSSDGKPMKGMKLFAGHAGISVQNAEGVYFSALPEIASSDAAIVFEGVTDYMAWKANRRLKEPGMDVVILNSVSNIGRAELFLSAHSKVILCLDNDGAGQKATAELSKVLLDRGVAVGDLRSAYASGEPIVRYVLSDDRNGILVKERGKERLTGFDEYWKDRLGKGPGDFNDYHVSIVRKAELKAKKRTPSKDNDDKTTNGIKIK